MMKKTIAVLAIVTTMATAGTAFAYKGMGNNGKGMHPDCPLLTQGGNPPVQMPQLDQKTKENIMKFCTDNAGLRKQMQMKQAEMRALMRSDNPDPKQAAALAGELFDLRYTLQNKARQAGLEGWMPMIGCDMRGIHGRGGGKGMGYGMKNRMAAPCPAQ